MPARISNTPVKFADALPYVNNDKLRLSLMGLMDKWEARARMWIYNIYNDDELLQLYKSYRDSGIFQKGSKSKVWREVVRFPHPIVYEFCRTVFEPMYGPGWELRRKVLRHELIRPWLLINLT